MRSKRCGCGSRQNARRGVVAAKVHAAARSGASWAAEGPADRSVGMTSATDRCAKRLRGAELHAGVWRRKGDGDVARDRELRGRRLRRVRLTRGGYLDNRRRGQVARRGVNPAVSYSSGGRTTTRDAVHAPVDDCVGGVCGRRGQRQGVS